jgi:CubicO group peptidase (beta-lactamase class C family)
VGLSSERLDRISLWIDSYIGDGKLPGGLALEARHGQVVYCQCRGQLDMEAGLPVWEDTIFRFYSMTKPITSTGWRIDPC